MYHHEDPAKDVAKEIFIEAMKDFLPRCHAGSKPGQVDATVAIIAKAAVRAEQELRAAFAVDKPATQVSLQRGLTAAQAKSIIENLK